MDGVGDSVGFRFAFNRWFGDVVLDAFLGVLDCFGLAEDAVCKTSKLGREGVRREAHLHLVASLSEDNSCIQPSSGVPISAVVMRVSFSRGVQIMGSISLMRLK